MALVWAVDYFCPT